MEDMLWKFPHVGKQIFKNLSNKNLAKSKKVARSWEHFITNENFYKQKVHYENKQKKGLWGRTPLHSAAEAGKISECKLIIDNVEDKNPQDNFGRTPLHLAAFNGKLSVCQLIINNVKDKNPKDKNGRTPLHEAAKLGQFKIFELIFENIEDKNPQDQSKETPLHYAAINGHLAICKHIISKVEDKNLVIKAKNFSNLNPLQLAKRHQQQHVVDYIKSQIEK